MPLSSARQHAFPSEQMLIPLHTPQPPLAERLRAQFRLQRDYFLDMVKLDEPAPEGSLRFSQWRQPEVFRALCDRYADANYGAHPDKAREEKPLHSLWSQWYFGLVVPPMMMALLTDSAALDCHPDRMRVEFHESGRAARFWFEVEEDHEARYLNAEQRLVRLITQHLMPVTNAIAAYEGINAKLIWSNTGYLVHWFLQELNPLIGDAARIHLEHRFFFSRTLCDGSDNPLYRTMIPREGVLSRRTCCQRYKLPDVNQCGDCTLNANAGSLCS